MKMSTTGIPPVRELATVNPSETAYMRANGAAPRAPAGWAPLESISPMLVAAAIMAEDSRFFVHHGVDWFMTMIMTRAMIKDRRLIGGVSTITQQLARNLYLTAARTVTRKLREIELALRMERHVSKARILELYLNLVEWGGGAWGCVAASRHYFQKAPRDLDLFESSFLVSLLPAPKRGLSGPHAERSRLRQFRVTNLMLLAGVADADSCAACLQRMRVLHRQVADGTPLVEALAAARPVETGAEAAFLRELVIALGIAPIAPPDLLTARFGCDQQQRAFGRLQERFGVNALRAVLATGSYDPLREATRAAQVSDAALESRRLP